MNTILETNMMWGPDQAQAQASLIYRPSRMSAWPEVVPHIAVAKVASSVQRSILGSFVFASVFRRWLGISSY